MTTWTAPTTAWASSGGRVEPARPVTAWVETSEGRHLLPRHEALPVDVHEPIIVGGLQAGQRAALLAVAARADIDGTVTLRLQRTRLADHAGLVPLEVDGRVVALIDILPTDKLSAQAWAVLVDDLLTTWEGLVFDPSGLTALRVEHSPTRRSPEATWRAIAGS